MGMIDKLRELIKKLDDPYFIKGFEEGFEKFLKERNMKTYHVKTQESYSQLMQELETQGYTWNGGFPTSINKFPFFKEQTAITIYESKAIKYSNVNDVKLYTKDKIVEYKAKEGGVTIYHVETQADYDALMIDLEAQGCRWSDGKKLNINNYYPRYKSETTIITYDDKSRVEFADIKYDMVHNPNIPIIEYKEKEEKMDEKQLKQQSIDLITNIASTIVSFPVDFGFDNKSLVETQKLAKEFNTALTEFIESRKPKFEIGDYVVDVITYQIAKIYDIADGYMDGGRYYDMKSNEFSPLDFGCRTDNARHATPEEIAEYKVALNFHKHGRKPFEVKKDDIIEENDAYFFVDNPEILGKEDFVSGEYTFVKTAEEVNEWIKGE